MTTASRSDELYDRRGTSGARVVVKPDFEWVLKYGDPGNPGVCQRLFEQATFMREIGTAVFPDVPVMFPHGYLMEKLLPIGSNLLSNATVHITHTVSLLEKIWQRQTHRVGARALTPIHEEYVLRRAHGFAPYMVPKLQAALKRLRKMKLTHVDRVHGDPTLDNLMRHTNGRLKLTDPIPASEKMPALAAHDLGKLLQSAWLGYEWTLRGKEDEYPGWESLRRGIPLMREEDAHAAWYFLAVHILRLLPYQPEPLRGRFASTLNLIPTLGFE